MSHSTMEMLVIQDKIIAVANTLIHEFQINFRLVEN